MANLDADLRVITLVEAAGILQVFKQTLIRLYK